MQFLKSQQKKISKEIVALDFMSGEASHKILFNLKHRGATGQDPLSGDGAGILVKFQTSFFVEVGMRKKNCP